MKDWKLYLDLKPELLVSSDELKQRVAEMGRQPWIVYGLMRTSDAVSPVPAEHVSTSLLAFIIVYSVLGLLDIFLLRKYAIKGPQGQED